MKTAKYVIDGTPIEVNMEGSPEAFLGRNELLSTNETDITYSQGWYDQGYRSFDFLTDAEFIHLKTGLRESISKLIKDAGKDFSGIKLEDYHRVINTNELHYAVVSKTRDLFAEDFNFPIEGMIPKFEEMVGFGLTDVEPQTKEKMHIIVRINRPGSMDFNPPHKDIYEGWDKNGRVPQFVNLWIPICGVTSKSSLPVVPRSHHLTEDKILRTFEGAVVEGNKYRVKAVVEWDGKNDLIRPEVKYGEVLLFSGHLIHGLAKNELEDQTRIALEFRLFKKD